jgi:hypothetical protein
MMVESSGLLGGRHMTMKFEEALKKNLEMLRAKIAK